MQDSFILKERCADSTMLRPKRENLSHDFCCRCCLPVKKIKYEYDFTVMYLLFQIYVIDSADKKRFEETGLVSLI